MAEGTMVMHGVNKSKKLADPKAAAGPCYDPYFLGTLDPALPVLQEKGVKLAVNAGASDPALLAKEIADRVKERGLTLKVAYIEGDECIDQIRELRKKGDPLRNLDTDKSIEDWGFEPIYAQYVSLLHSSVRSIVTDNRQVLPWLFRHRRGT
jgi:hypothetical protein